MYPLTLAGEAIAQPELAAELGWHLNGLTNRLVAAAQHTLARLEVVLDVSKMPYSTGPTTSTCACAGIPTTNNVATNDQRVNDMTCSFQCAEPAGYDVAITAS